MEDSSHQNTAGDRLNGKARKFPKGSSEAKEQFVEMRSQGMSYDQIAGQLRVSRQCLLNWSKELNASLENAKAFQMDAIKAKYQMLQVHRVEQFSQMLHRLREEVQKRDLSEIPTDKLIDLFLKFTKEARSEEVELYFTETAIEFATSPLQDDWLKKRPMI